MTPPRSTWQPILNDAGAQVGWLIPGEAPIRFSTPEIFLQVEGRLQAAAAMKRNAIQKARALGERATKKPKAQKKQKKGKRKR